MPPLDTNRFQSLLDPLGWMLFRLNQALDEGPPARPPRWVRIASARQLPAEMAAYQTAKAGVTAWIELVSAVHELVLDLGELLDPITADKQKLEDTLRQLRKTLDDPSLTLSTGVLPSLTLSVQGIKDVLDALILAADLFPDGTDAALLGNQIYSLLAIKPTPPPRLPLGGRAPPSVDISATGKLRLLQWAFDLSWPVHGLGTKEKPEEATVPVRRLGSRWLAVGKNEDQSPLGRAIWVDGSIGARSVPVYELYFNSAEAVEASQTIDFASLHGVLESLGYFAGPVRPDLRRQFHPALSDALEAFQAINGLPRTRLLDTATLNRLYHLDVGALGTRRAKPLDADLWAAVPSPPPLPPIEVTVEIKRPYPVVVLTETPLQGSIRGAFNLRNADANAPDEEGIAPEQESTGTQDVPASQIEGRTCYRYYRCGRAPQGGKVVFPKGILRGWIRHNGEADPLGGGPIGSGFVALESRVLRGTEFDGGARSEGATPNGSFFFAARHQAPSVAGRSGPAANPIWKPVGLEKGALVGLYQWLDLALLAGICEPGEVVSLRASAAMRVQVPAKGETAQGRVVLALVTRAVWEANRYGTVFDAKQATEVKETGWFPDDDPSRLRSWQSKLGQGPMGPAMLAKLWVERSTEALRWTVGADAPVLYVGLHGKSVGGEDVGAYFDGVRVVWERGAMEVTK